LNDTLCTWFAEQTHHATLIDSAETFSKTFSKTFLQHNADWLTAYLRKNKMREYQNVFYYNLSAVTVEQSKELVENQTTCFTKDGSLQAIICPAIMTHDLNNDLNNHWEWLDLAHGPAVPIIRGFPDRCKSVCFNEDDTVFSVYFENGDVDHYAVPWQTIKMAFNFEQLCFLSALVSVDFKKRYSQFKPEQTVIIKLQQWKEKLYNSFQTEEKTIMDKILR
jgi:hypothetical protein